MAKGRKNKYQTHVEPRLKDIEHWCRDGLIEEVICKRLGVSVRSFNEYKSKFPQLSQSLKRGKEEADYAVEDALFKRALGYEFEEKTYETQVFVKKTETAEGSIIEEPFTEEILTKRVIKQVSPDTTAAIFWLKNRRPDKWRDKQDIEHSGGVTNQIDLSGLTAEELRKLANSDD